MKDVDSEKVQETKIPKISTVLDNLKCTESVSVNNYWTISVKL